MAEVYQLIVGLLDVLFGCNNFVKYIHLLLLNVSIFRFETIQLADKCINLLTVL